MVWRYNSTEKEDLQLVLTLMTFPVSPWSQDQNSGTWPLICIYDGCSTQGHVITFVTLSERLFVLRQSKKLQCQSKDRWEEERGGRGGGGERGDGEGNNYHNSTWKWFIQQGSPNSASQVIPLFPNLQLTVHSYLNTPRYKYGLLKDNMHCSNGNVYIHFLKRRPSRKEKRKEKRKGENGKLIQKQSQP